MTNVIVYDNMIIKAGIGIEVLEELKWEIEYYQKENGEIPIEDFLLKLNPKLPKFSSNITRIFYFLFEKNTFVLLHGILKKGDKPSERDLERALNYKFDYERRCQDE